MTPDPMQFWERCQDLKPAIMFLLLQVRFVSSTYLFILAEENCRGEKSGRLTTAAVIMLMLPIPVLGLSLGLPIGIWALVVLNKPEVRRRIVPEFSPSAYGNETLMITKSG